MPNADLSWQSWLALYCPEYRHFAPRHLDCWNWFAALQSGTRPRPAIWVWPRGGGKSSTVEWACALMCARACRRYVLYVCGTQKQANDHVQSIASNLGRLGVERAVNEYGASRGWRQNLLRTANGFNVAALGLDAAIRGAKLDQYRPDFILLDDIDSLDDNLLIREKKVRILTHDIFPTGSVDCAVAGVQNLIYDDSIFSQLVDGRAQFLMDRQVFPVEVAVEGLKTEIVTGEDGANRYRITAGTPTWKGQSLATCEQQINTFGLDAFLRESQQEVQGAQGYVFNGEVVRYIDAHEVPTNIPRVRAWDLAATHGGGCWTVGTLMALAPNGIEYVLDIVRGQWDSDEVDRQIIETARADGKMVALRLPQDPGAAGKKEKLGFEKTLKEYHPLIEPVTGDKITRARNFAAKWNSGNVFLVRSHWNKPLVQELKAIRDPLPTGMICDQMDACSDAHNHLNSKRNFTYATAGTPNQAITGYRPR